MTSMQSQMTTRHDLNNMFEKCLPLEKTSAHSTVVLSEDDFSIPSEEAERLVRQTELRVSQLINATSYLQYNHKMDALRLFERHDIQVGDRIAYGGFSTVCDITSFQNPRHLLDGERYVIKSLTPRLAHETKKFMMGARDLVMEAYFLSALSHKHIIQLRGCSAAGISGFAETCRSDGFFLIYEKLTATLGQRIVQWREECNDAQKAKGLVSRSASIGDERLVERINAAIDIASAIEYLHSKRILYRDIKPANVGFAMDGTLQIFDFGLAVELPFTKNPDATFHLGGNTGTPRYMAVEVIQRKPYNLKADVFSFSILLWEIVAMLKPYNGLPGPQVKEMVSLRGTRPHIPWSWSFSLRKLLKRGWSQNPVERPTMANVKSTLEKIRDDICPGKKSRLSILGG